MRRRSREEAERRQGLLLPMSKKGAPMAIMEPLVYLLVTTTTLTSYARPRQATMATLHVVYESVSILLDIGGARLIRDLGGIIGT